MGVQKTRLISDNGIMLWPSLLRGGTLLTASFLSSSDKYLALVMSGMSGK